MTEISSQSQDENSALFNQENLEKEKVNFKAEVEKFRTNKVSKLRTVNHWWNISLTVSGITFTLLATVLGVVESEQLKGWIKFGIGLSGAVAVAAQSANSEFRVRRKAGEYTLVEAEAIVLEHQIPYVRNESELEKLRSNYYALVRRSAEAEASSHQED